MGVSGCGKSSVGALLAERLNASFIEGDSFHPPGNISKMSAGVPLEDADRWPWLELIGVRLADVCDLQETIIVSCSALRKVYRDKLRQATGGRLFFVFLDGSDDVLYKRMSARGGHFMPTSMLDSQLKTLEKPTGESDVITIDIGTSPERIVEAALAGLARLTA